MLSWFEEGRKKLGTFAMSTSALAQQNTGYIPGMVRSFTSTPLGTILGRSFPKKSTRYMHAMGAMGFLVTIVTAMDWMTTIQLKNSPYFEYSFKAVQQNAEVKQLLGEDIKSPWRVSVKKHKRRFQLSYTLKGKEGNWAQVVAASTIDPKRGVINEQAFRYIVVQPTNIHKICFGVVTDGLYDLAAIIGKDHWFAETNEDRQKRRENEILVVDRVGETATL